MGELTLLFVDPTTPAGRRPRAGPIFSTRLPIPG